MKQITILISILFAYSATQAQIYDEYKIYSSPNPAENVQFGSSISISGDYMVVGVPKENKTYLYTKTETDWQYVAVLTPTDSEDGKNFGHDVDIYGDVVVVGAPGSNTTTYVDGATYVFVKPVSGWTDMTETAKLSRTLNSDEEFWGNPDYDFFGGSVAIHKNIIVIGASKYNSDNYNLCGGVFVYEKPETGWADMTETAKLTASDENNNLNLGRSVAVYGDIIVAGEGRMNTNSAAYLFQKPTDGWSNCNETAKFKSSDGKATFGNDISIDSNTIVIGAYISDGAYVFDKPQNGWTNMTETALLSRSDGMDGDDFGTSVSVSGNFIIVGAPRAYDRTHGIDGGLAYFYEKPDTGWTNMKETAVLYASNAMYFDEFGFSVVNDDDEILIGARYTSSNSLSKSGSFYQYNYIFEPQDILLNNNTIDECSDINKSIGGFTAIDGNRHDIHTYELIDDAGNSYDNNAFLISGDSIYNNTNLDYEKKNSYTVFVEVTDTTGLSFSKSFEININNIEPILTDANFTVQQKSPQHSFVGDLNCTGDTNSIWYEIEYNNYGLAFNVDSLTGTISVNKPNALDPDIYDYFDLHISVNDRYYRNDALVMIEYETGLTGINESNQNDILVYPNPSNGLVTIESQEAIDRIVVIYLDGRIIEEHSVNKDHRCTLSLESGVYITQIWTNKGIRVEKVLVK